jgi:hypothetical protein
MRFVVAFLAVASLVGGAWVFSLPTKAECVASGRVVDPTERHCESSDGYQQLQEHALFHSREAILAGVIVLGVSYGISRYRRRRSGVATQ